MNYCDKSTQTERFGPKLFKIDSFGTLKFDRYYFDPASETILTIRTGKNGIIRKQIKPTKTHGDKFVVSLRDTDNKPRTINYANLIEFCRELMEFEEM